MKQLTLTPFIPFTKVRSPLLEIRRVALTFNDIPVEFRRSLVNTEHYEYLSELAKTGSG